MTESNKRIDEFLKFFRDIALENPNMQLDDNIVYNKLIELGVSVKGNISNYFNNWIDRYKSNKNINVFVAPYWKYFCQFISNDKKAEFSSEHLKVYIPLDKEHIENGANIIFDFLTENNISHLSKIGSHVRFDDIVIRLVNPDDLVKLINFVNSNQYIKEGLIKANPFAFNFHGMAFAVDGHLSYNSTVASLVAYYINEKKATNKLDTVGVDDFYNFVQDYYNKVFIQKDLKKLEPVFNINVDNIEEYEVVNYMDVINLILKVGRGCTFKDYIQHYNECRNEIIQAKKQENLYSTEELSFDSNDLNLEQINNLNNMIIRAINVMTIRFGSEQQAISQLKLYFETGYGNYITRQQNLRNDIVNSSFRKDLESALKKYNVDFDMYVKAVLKNQKNNDDLIDDKELEVSKLTQEIISVMSNKYGLETAIVNLRFYLSTGQANYITRDNNLRSRVVNSNYRNNLKAILDYKNISLDVYVSILIDEQKTDNNFDNNGVSQKK